MKYAVASDIHGSSFWCDKLIKDIEQQRVDGIILLGDLMYHGPRNALPEGYDPANVAQQLNGLSTSIVAVRGNCDSEVDQMLLDFPCMGDYAIVVEGETRLFCTHGHLPFNDKTCSLPDDSVILNGHSHIKRDETIDGIRYLNPGSVGIPKDGTHSYLIYDGGEVEFRLL